MKAISTIKFSFALLTSCLVLLNACKREPFEDFKLKVKTKQGTNVGGIFTDANTGALVQEEIIIKVSGVDADKIYSTMGEKGTTYTIKGGVLNFQVDPDIAVSATNPLKIRISASAAGYIENYVDLTIDDPQMVSYEIVMVNENDKPNGVYSSTKATITTSNDTTTADISVTATDPVSGLVATFTISSGTTIPGGGNGQEFSFTAFSGFDSKSLAALPGGLNGIIDNSSGKKDGTESLISTESLILLHGYKIEKHSMLKYYYHATVDLRSIDNPVTGQKFKESDEIIVIKNYKDHVIVRYECTVSSLLDVPGCLHNQDLYSFALYVVNPNPPCNKNITIKSGCSNTSGTVDIKAKGLNGGDAGGWRQKANIVDGKAELKNVPSNIPLHLMINVGGNEIHNGDLAAGEICNFPDPILNNALNNSEVVLKAACPDLEVFPSFWIVYVKKGGMGAYNFAYIDKGKHSFCLEPNTTYDVLFFYNKKLEKRQFTTNASGVIELEKVQLEGDICNYLKGKK